MSDLDDLIREMRAEEAPPPDWKSVDEKLFARLEAEPKPHSEEEPERVGGRVIWMGAAVSLAVAAAALLMVQPSASPGTTTPVALSAGSFAGGGADVLIGTTQANAGKQLAQGDIITVAAGTAYFDQPNAVRWTAPRGSKLHVEHAASPFVLGLEQGVAEAQVTPVPVGEAFAIDVTASTGGVMRVAVHGTHLRVAREGDKIIVDLTEGVVSIGAPPKRGSTFGALVTAPAHVELDARDITTMHIDHDLASVRPAEAVTPPSVVAVAPQSNPSAQGGSGLLEADVAMDHHTRATQRSTPQTSPAPTVEAALRSSDDIASAVKVCLDANHPSGSGITFRTDLSLRVGDDGYVTAARFYPPLDPNPTLQDCADHAIWKRTRLTQTGDIVIPIVMTR